MSNKYTEFVVDSDMPLFSKHYVTEKGNYGLVVQALSVSDGHHTMEELYEHRHSLFIALIRVIDSNITPLGATSLRCWKSKLHSDGSSYEGWFIAGIYKPRVDGTEWQISYHLPIRLWDSVNCIELDRGREWDGHTPADVIERLKSI